MQKCDAVMFQLCVSKGGLLRYALLDEIVFILFSSPKLKAHG